MNQTLDFTHGIENNQESEANYIKHLDEFNRQCRIVLEQLLTGQRMNVRDSLIYLGIGHLPRRIKDLREAGIPVEDEFPLLDDGKKGRFKEYWLEKEFINEFLDSTK
ncbi:MAG: hypothetical protein AAGF96_06080 [Bacteroidota bacterium]